MDRRRPGNRGRFFAVLIHIFRSERDPRDNPSDHYAWVGALALRLQRGGQARQIIWINSDRSPKLAAIAQQDLNVLRLARSPLHDLDELLARSGRTAFLALTCARPAEPLPPPRQALWVKAVLQRKGAVAVRAVGTIDHRLGVGLRPLAIPRYHRPSVADLSGDSSRGSSGAYLPLPYPRRIGRSESYDRFIEEREGWLAVAELGAHGARGWKAHLRRATRPLTGFLGDTMARALQRR